MSYLKRKGIKRAGELYRFTEKEMNALVMDFVKEKTGMNLTLRVGYSDDEQELAVYGYDSSNPNIKATPDQREVLYNLGIDEQDISGVTEFFLPALFGSSDLEYTWYYDESTLMFKFLVKENRLSFTN